MRNIYLASDSQARKKLLSLSGLKFKVLNSGVKERRAAASLSYASLVKRNALAKAKDVARRVKGGVIIQPQIAAEPKDVDCGVVGQFTRFSLCRCDLIFGN